MKRPDRSKPPPRTEFEKFVVDKKQGKPPIERDVVVTPPPRKRKRARVEVEPEELEQTRRRRRGSRSSK